MTEDRTLELHTNASQGALEYLRLARDSLACIEGDMHVNVTRLQLNGLMKSVENFHTRAARKLRYQNQMETKHENEASASEA